MTRKVLAKSCGTLSSGRSGRGSGGGLQEQEQKQKDLYNRAQEGRGGMEQLSGAGIGRAFGAMQMGPLLHRRQAGGSTPDS